MDYQVTTEHVEARPLAALRVETSRDNLGPAMDQVLGRLFHAVPAMGLTCIGAPVVIYNRFDEESVDMDVAVPVDHPFDEAEGIRPLSLPEGEAAVITHVGPYDTIGAAWEALGSWVQQHGHAYDAMCWEEYVTDPQVEPDPARYVTKLYWIIK